MADKPVDGRCRDDTPRTVEEIEARNAELAFSAHFMRKVRMFSRAADCASPGLLTMGRLKRRLQKVHFHMIDSSQLASLLRTDTKQSAHPPFLERLREQGQARASTWLAEHFDGVGHRSTVDVKKWFA